MRIVDGHWFPDINRYVVVCFCGWSFYHRMDRHKVVCPKCGAQDEVYDMRDRELKADQERRKSGG